MIPLLHGLSVPAARWLNLVVPLNPIDVNLPFTLSSGDPHNLASLFWLWLILLLVWIPVVIVPMTGLGYAAYYGFSLPLRRRERARLFLDLLEIGLRQGHTAEETIRSVSRCHDSRLGVRFYLLVTFIEAGQRLGEAIRSVPRLLPPVVAAMLEVGERTGDLLRVLPACRRWLNDGLSQLVKAQNYFLVLVVVALPVWGAVGLVLTTYVLPRWMEILKAMEVPAPAILTWWLRALPWMSFVPGMVAFLLVFGTALYVGGPRVMGWLERLAPGITSRFHYALPWHRKRMQRDFSAMLASLLDAGVPEAEAVNLAARCARNRIVQAQADRVVKALEQGAGLAEALRPFAAVGQLQWRVANASRGRDGFVRALEGWHEALEAQAYQQEQAFAHLLTTGLVLFNGLLVVFLALTFFQPLIALVKEAVLW